MLSGQTLFEVPTILSRAICDGHKCVSNKDGADFPAVLEFDHTMAGDSASTEIEGGIDFRPQIVAGFGPTLLF
jgi:hypothetical protein